MRKIKLLALALSLFFVIGVLASCKKDAEPPAEDSAPQDSVSDEPQSGEQGGEDNGNQNNGEQGGEQGGEYTGEFTTPVLRFVVASDIHLDKTGDAYQRQYEKLFETAYAYAESQTDYNKLDAIIIAGDCTDDGTKAQMELFFNIARIRTKADTDFIAIMGNHEFNTTRNTYKDEKESDTFASDVDALTISWFTEASGEDDVNFHKVINGYHFIVFSPDTGPGGWHWTGRYYTEAKLQWVKAELDKAVADDPTGQKPIFCIEHIPPTNSANAVGVKVSEALDTLLHDYPQVITAFGHSHNHINSVTSIHQEYYTALNTGGFKTNNLGHIDGYEHADNASDAAKNIQGGGYYIIEVDANHTVRVKAYEVNQEKLYDFTYIIRTGNTELFTYTDARAETAGAPEFSNDAKVVIERGAADMLQFSFDQAHGEYIPVYYRVELFVDGKSQGSKMINSGMQWISAPDIVTVTFDGIEFGEKYTVSVVAINEWGKESEPFTFTYEPFENEDYSGVSEQGKDGDIDLAA